LEGVEAGTITAVFGIVSLALGAWLGTPRSQGGGNGLKHNAPRAMLAVLTASGVDVFEPATCAAMQITQGRSSR
jgi:hypothetical protein